MKLIDDALALLKNLLLDVVALFIAVFVAIEAWVRVALAQAGVPPGPSNIILLALAAFLIIAAARLFGGLLRIVLLLFLVLLLFHMLTNGVARI